MDISSVGLNATVNNTPIYKRPLALYSLADIPPTNIRPYPYTLYGQYLILPFNYTLNTNLTDCTLIPYTINTLDISTFLAVKSF